jgi:hypothetical protein
MAEFPSEVHSMASECQGENCDWDPSTLDRNGVSEKFDSALKAQSDCPGEICNIDKPPRETPPPMQDRI